MVLAGKLGGDAFLWTQATGITTMPRPDTLDPQDSVFANAMTDDGTRVFGAVRPGGEFSLTQPYAYVFTHDKGHRSLTDVVKAAGIAIPADMTLDNVLGVSSDGTVLVGSSYTLDQSTGISTSKSFVLRVAPGTF
jgi:hypothetical protein